MIRNDMIAMTTGVHPGVSLAAYHAIEAVNNSKLKMLRRTPAHGYYEMTHPKEDTESLRKGDATHVAILEPERFAREYVRRPEFNRRTNQGKADAAAWAAEHPNHATLLPDEWDAAVAMRDAVWAQPVAREMLSAPGHNEMTALWTDATTSLRCKGRIDRLTMHRDYSTVIDIKTTRDAGRDAFSREIHKYGYHAQAAFYLDGLNIIAPRSRRFIHLVVENTPPHCVALWELGPLSIEEGRRQYRHALDQYAECKLTGRWPGYTVEIDSIDIPKWSHEFVNPQE